MTDSRVIKFPDNINIDAIKFMIDEIQESLEDTPGCGFYAELESAGDEELTLFAEQHDSDLVIGLSDVIEEIEKLAGFLRRVIARSGVA